jgi:hypothetical protein
VGLYYVIPNARRELPIWAELTNVSTDIRETVHHRYAAAARVVAEAPVLR